MPEHGDDVGQCCNGLTTPRYRAAPPADRVVYRSWIVGMLVFYSALLFMVGAASYLVEQGGLTKLTRLSLPAARSHKPD
jgi:hypothetical protein